MTFEDLKRLMDDPLEPEGIFWRIAQDWSEIDRLMAFTYLSELFYINASRHARTQHEMQQILSRRRKEHKAINQILWAKQ